MPVSNRQFKSFSEFYPFYLSEHSHHICRQLHFVGTTCVLGLLAAFAITGQSSLLVGMPLAGYGFAWLGHFVFEKNRPATFRHPFYSFIGDFAMYRDIWLGRVSLRRTKT
jgi:hypothetical protein